MKRIAGRLGGFAANGVVTGVATLLSITLIVNLHGPKTWSIFAVAQSAGMLIAVLVGFGWAVVGPATIAPLSDSERRREYSIAVITRAGIFVLIAVSCATAALVGAPELADYLPVTVAYASTGLSSLWYYVGTGRAWPSFFRDALPRALASIAAPIAALFGPTQMMLGAVVFAGSLVALLLSVRYVRNQVSGRPAALSGEAFRASISKQWHGLLSGGVSAVYMTVPTIIVGVLAPAAAGVFALGDKFVRLSSAAVLPITQVLQGWVPRASSAERRSRVIRAARIAGLLATAAGTVLASCGPIAAYLFTSGQIELGFVLTIPMGLILACTLITQVLGAGCLGAFGDFRSIALSAVVGASVGLPALFIATVTFGIAGTMWAVFIAEGAVLIFQSVALSRHLRR